MPQLTLDKSKFEAIKKLDTSKFQLDTSKFNTPSNDEDTPDVPSDEKPGFLRRLWDATSEPLTKLPSEFARTISSHIDQPSNEDESYLSGLKARAKGFLAGATEGLGDLASSMTSPQNLLFMALSGGSSLAEKQGLETVANALKTGERIVSAPVLAHGATQTFGKDKTLGERAFGVAEMAGGAAGMASHTPSVEPEIKPEIPITKKIIPENEPIDPVAAVREKIINGDTVTVKPEKDLIDQYKSQGYKFDSMTDEGHIVMKKEPFNVPTEDSDFAPQEMKVPGVKTNGQENIAVGGADPRVLKVLGSSLYSGERPKVVVKELLQNAFDEHRIAGVTDPIKVMFSASDKHPVTNKVSPSVTVKDSGRGLTPEELYTVFTDVGKTGKGNEAGASGGFGFAKAAPLLTGEYAEVKSIVNQGGQKYEYQFKGTPSELVDQMKGVPLVKRKVSSDTPTGMVVKTYFPEDTYLAPAEDMAENMTKKSHSITSDVQTMRTYHDDNGYGKYFLGESNHNLDPDTQKYINENYIKTHRKEEPPPIVDSIKTPGARIDIRYDPKKNSTSNGFEKHILNKGLYQNNIYSSYGMYLDKVPVNIDFDIHATVEEGEPHYPYTANRETLDSGVEEAIKKWVDDNIVSGALKSQKKRLENLYSNMVSIGKGARDIVFYNAGEKLTPAEIEEFQTHPVINKMGTAIDDMLDRILIKTGRAEWIKKLEKVGFTTDENVYGIHIPNPENPSGKSAILINPFQHMVDGTPPADAAFDTVVTALHEAAHIGKEKFIESKIPDAEINDPRIGKYFQSYLQQVQTQGGLNAGHSADFLHRLGETYAKFGPKEFFKSADNIHSIVTDETGRYSPEVQKLLSIYKESRGREVANEDILSGTGVKQETPTTGKGNVSGDDKTAPNGNAPKFKVGQVVVMKKGKASPLLVKQALEQGFEFEGVNDLGDMRWKKVRESGPKQPILESEVGTNRPKLGPDIDSKQASIVKEVLNFPRALMASMDFSAPLRQGLPLIHKKQFWTSLDDMFRAWGSEKAYEAIQKSISDKPLFKPRVLANGKILPSFAEQAGLKLSDLKQLNNREEFLASTWAEKIPGVRRSNRAYTAFLNKLRADTFESLVNNGKVFGADATVNVPLARELADFVNTASGRGSLKFGKLNLEQSASNLGTVFFAPRLIASRLKLLNPAYYVMASPTVRKEAIKSLFAVAAAGNTVAQLGKMMGGTVETNPNSSDYGKIKIGNYRMDPWAGFQQYIVAANRLIRPQAASMEVGNENTGIAPLDLATGMVQHGGGQIKSSTTGRTYKFSDAKFGRPTRFDTAIRFGEGKLNPVLSFVTGLMRGKDFTGAPFNVPEEIADRFVPIFLQDLLSVATESPDLLQGAAELVKGNVKPENLPLAIPSMFGMGSQVYGGKQ